MATAQVYGKFGANILGGEVAGDALQMDWLSDAIKASLHTATYTPNIDTNEVFADATNELGTANGYTAGGATLVQTESYNATGNVTTYDCSDFSWTASGGSLVFQYVVVRDSTVATAPLVCYIDCGAQTITTGNTFTVATGANGLFQITVT